MRYAMLVIALLTAAVCACSQDAEQRWDVPLTQCALEGTKLTRAGVVPLATYTPEGTEPLRMEAEAASDLRGPVVQIADQASSGGARIDVPDGTYRGTGAAAVFAVEAPVAGSFRLWVRTFWPDIGGNSFFLGLDDQEEQVFGNTEGPQVIGVWHWLAGPTWELAAGGHTITVRWREDGTQLDLALLADTAYAPTDAADMNRPAQAAPPIRTVITTPELRPESVAAWGQISLKPEAVVASATVSASTDGGATWQALEGGDLASVPARGDGADRLRLRIAISDPRPDLSLEEIAVSYRGGPWKITLADERVAFDFSLADGRIIGIRNLATDTQVASSAGPLFRLDYLAHDGDEVQTIPDEAVTFRGHEFMGVRPGIDLHYTVEAPGGSVRVRCHGELPAGGLPSWWIEVTNEAQGIDIVEVHFPRVSGVRIGPDEQDDWLVWPYWGCRRIPEPTRNAPGRALYPSGRAGMNWLDLYEEGEGGQGLYLASEDETVMVGEILAQADEGAGTVTIGMSKMPRIAPGESFRSENFVIAPHEGDWHWAADRYREWLYGWMPPGDQPNWVVECDGWLGSGRGTNFLEDLPARYRLARELGLNYIENWGQMMCGVAAGESCCNRLYFPDPRYGSEVDFAKAIGYVREAGGHIGFYTNGQAWNPRYPKLRECYDGLLPEDILIPDWESEAHNWGVIRADGSYVPQYAKPEGDDSPYPCSFFLMCSHARGWQDYLHHYIVDKYVRQYGVDAMYVDQVAAATAQVCFAKGHGHDDCVGAWGRGHLENFRRLKTDGQQTEPDFALATEGFADIYGQYVDIFLLSPVASRRWAYVAPEVLRYTLPEFIYYDGFANGTKGATLSSEQIMNEVFLLGNRFDLFKRSPEAMDHFKRVLRLRQETGPLLYRGRFLDEIGLTIGDERVRAKLWRLDNEDARGWLVNIYNEERVEGASVSVQVGDAGAVSGLVGTLDQPLGPAEIEVQDGRVRFEAPTDLLSTVLLLTEVRPWMLRAFAPVTTAGAEDAVEVRYRPLSGAEGTQGSASLEAPAGWATREVAFAADVSQDVRLPFTVPADATPGIYPVTVTVRIGDDTWTSRETVILDEPLAVEVEVQAGRLLVKLTSVSPAPLEVTCSASGPEWLRFPDPPATVTVPPRESASCAIPWRAPDGVPEDAEVVVTVLLGGREYRASAEFAPLGLSPARWRPQRYEGEVSSSRNENTGTLVIRTASEQDRGGWTWRTALVEPGARYRFTVQCRIEGLVSAEQGAKVRIIFPHRDGGNRGAGPTVYTEPLTGDNDWTEVAAEFEVPEETGVMQIELFNWHATGLSEWRGMSLARLE
jgi:hypothetical protein